MRSLPGPLGASRMKHFVMSCLNRSRKHFRSTILFCVCTALWSHRATMTAKAICCNGFEH